MSPNSDKLRVLAHLGVSDDNDAGKQALPCGTWPSALSAAEVAAAGNSLQGVSLDADGSLVWLEARPADAGRHVLVRQCPRGERSDLTPANMSARTRVHEYGGASYCVHRGEVFFSNDGDQRVYRQQMSRPTAVKALTPEGVRFADFSVDPGRQRLLAVFEDHRRSGEPINGIAAISFSGGFEVLWKQSDFVASPRISPDGATLVFIAWQHPNMPWDNTRLVIAQMDRDGRVSGFHELACSAGEALQAPAFAPDGRLYVISDRSNWWNLYRVAGERLVPVREDRAEYAGPAWNLGGGHYGFLSASQAVVTINHLGLRSLARLDLDSGELQVFELPWTGYSSLCCSRDTLVAIAAAVDELPALLRVDPSSGEAQVLYRPACSPLPPEQVAEVQVVEYLSEGGRTAHAFYHPPRNAAFRVPDGELPPLLVMLHGGPTAQSSPSLSLATQFWTTRGFAVVNVNYGGSTGYGREYRRSLYGQWGVVDVQDAVMAAQRLAEAGCADPARLLIRGGSAGGYTTLAALAFADTFAAGGNYYGVSDALALAQETHKFESRYLDQLIGPLPEAIELYRERSPIAHLQGFTRPLITFQGLEDKIVPPSQSQAIFDALCAKGVATAYVTFEGEQHGFRRAANQIRALEAELYFYGRVLGFQPADGIEPVDIVNL